MLLKSRGLGVTLSMEQSRTKARGTDARFFRRCQEKFLQFELVRSETNSIRFGVLQKTTFSNKYLTQKISSAGNSGPGEENERSRIRGGKQS